MFVLEREKNLKRLSLYWLGLSFQGGLLNAAGFLAVRRFVSHLTGLATYVGVDLVHYKFLGALSFLSLLLFFLFGSMVTAFFVNRGLKFTPKYEKVFFLLIALLLLCMIFGISGVFGDYKSLDQGLNHYSFSAILSFACGMQNALFGVKSGWVIRTTHLTGTATDLGHGLVNVLFKRAYSQEEHKMEVIYNWMRSGSLLLFILGAGAGTLIFNAFGFQGLALPVFIYALYFMDAHQFARTLKRHP